jgi:hypothetical protein
MVVALGGAGLVVVVSMVLVDGRWLLCDCGAGAGCWVVVVVVVVMGGGCGCGGAGWW